MDIYTLRKWGKIAHLDVMFNIDLVAICFWANGYSVYFVFSLFFLSFVYGFFALRTKSILNRKTVELLVKLDKKAFNWAQKKLKEDPSHSLARMFCPLEWRDAKIE